MGISSAIVRAAANTSTGNQDFTASLEGLTPKAAVVWITRATVDATEADNALLFVGLYHDGSRGTNQCTAFQSKDAEATSLTEIYQETNHDIGFETAAQNAVDATGTVSFISNGIRINWTDAPGSAYLVTVWLFAGSDLSAHSDTITSPNAINGSVDVTDPGFEPDLLILVASGGSALSLGFVHNDRSGTVTQRSAYIRSRNGRGTMEVYGGQSVDYAGTVGSGGFTSDANSKIEVSNFDSSGFTITERIAASGSGSRITYLALRLGAGPLVEGKVYTFGSPASTTPGSQTDTGPGFRPQFVAYVTGQWGGVNSYYTDGRAGVFGATGITADLQVQNLVTDQDAIADSDTASLSSDQAVQVLAHNGEATHTATFTEFTSNGVTLNWSLAQTSADYWPAMAIESEIVVPDDLLISTSDSSTISESTDFEFSEPTIWIYNSSTTWTAPPNVTSIQVEAWGAGGRGGNAVFPVTPSRGGGGGGAYARSLIPVTPEEEYNVTVGTTSGASTSFTGDSGVQILAVGGQNASDDNTSAGAGGSAGSSIGNQATYSGGNGGSGNASETAGGGGGGGAGGSTENGSNGSSTISNLGGSGGTGGNVGGGSGSAGGNAETTSVVAGTAPGGGGGGVGGHTSGTTRNGGLGAAGRLVITINYSQSASTSDSTTLSDSAQVRIETFVSAAESVEVEDTPDFEIATRFISVSDNVSASDSPSVFVRHPANWTYDTSGTWTAPTGVTAIIVEAWGGGGRGGNKAQFSSSSRKGGGGGAYARSEIPVTPGEDYTVTVGGAGGTSSFTGDSSVQVLAVGGQNGSDSTTTGGGAGGAAGSCIGNQATYSGGNGGNGNSSATAGGGGGGGAGGSTEAGSSGGTTITNAGGAGGNGGDIGGGNGGPGGNSDTNGNPGNAPGGGGGGAGANDLGAARNGGAGAPGRIFITAVVFPYPEVVNDTVLSEFVSVRFESNIFTTEEAISTSEASSVVLSDPQISVSDTVEVGEAGPVQDFVLVSESIEITVGVDGTLFVTRSDTTGITESVSSAVSIGVGVSDTVDVRESGPVQDFVLVSESVNLTIGIQESWDVSVQDETPLTESWSVLLSDFEISVSDSSAVSENSLLEVDTDVQSTETVDSSDVPTLEVLVNVGVGEEISLGESFQLDIPVLVFSDDLVETQESVVTETGILIPVADNISILEEVSGEILVSLPVEDAAGLSENLQIDIGVFSYTVDSASVTDTASADIPVLLDTEDEISSSDSVETLLVSFIESSENVSVSEDFLGIVPVSLHVENTVSVSENIQTGSGRFAQAADEIVVTESVHGEVPVHLQASETLSVTENSSLSINSFTGVEETVSLSENSQVQLDLLISSEEETSLADSAQAVVPIDIAAQDSIAVSENSSVFAGQILDLYISALENVSTSESTDLYLETFIGLQDNSQITDTPEISLSLQIDVLDEISTNDSAEGETGISLFVSEAVSITEFRRIDIPVWVSSSDNSSLSELVSAALFQSIYATDSVDTLDIVNLVTSDPNAYGLDMVGIVDQPTIGPLAQPNPYTWDTIATTEQVSLFVQTFATPLERIYQVKGKRVLVVEEDCSSSASPTPVNLGGRVHLVYGSRVIVIGNGNCE